VRGLPSEHSPLLSAPLGYYLAKAGIT